MDCSSPDDDDSRDMPAELRATHTNFLLMAETVPAALVRHILRPDGTEEVLYMSPRCVDLWEVQPERIRDDATLLWQMVDLEDLPGMQAALITSAHTLEPWRFEWRITTPSGRLKWLQGSGRPERADGGTIVFSSLIVDVTERREAHEALRRSEQRLQQLMAITGEGLWDWDIDRGLVSHNPRWCELLHLTADHMQHPLEGFIERVHEADRESVMARLQSCLHGTGPYRSEHRMLRGDGSVIWVEDRGDVVERLADGSPRRMLGSMTDISDRIAAVDARAAKEAAELANRAKSSFLARMSHELRTPLNAVLGFAQLLELDPALRLSPKAPQHLRYVRDAGEHLLKMIDEVLDLSRIESGTLRLSIEPVDAELLVDDTFALLRPLANSHAVALHLHRDRSPSWLMADHTRLRQVLLNLISNAVKYNRRGGTVDVHIRRRSDLVRIDVRDTGRGLDSSQLAGLFEPFNRVGAETGSIQGTGLGLVISRQLSEAMGGSLEVESTPGLGSVFSVLLPTAASPSYAAPDSLHSSLELDYPVAPMRVLYVEDNLLNVEVVRQALSLVPGVTLTVELDGARGLESARRDPPDVVLVDLNLPVLSGLELLQQLRSDPITSSIPCVAVSANALDADIAHARGAGFDAYLTKPIRLQALVRAVTALRPRRTP
jgi:PAS domain S-box-containing protein